MGAPQATPEGFCLDSFDKTIAADYAEAQKSSSLSPEKQLLAAVLQSALDDLAPWKKRNNQYDENRRRKVRENAMEWVLSDHTGWVFDFKNVCEILEIDPLLVRAALLKRENEKTKTKKIP